MRLGYIEQLHFNKNKQQKDTSLKFFPHLSYQLEKWNFRYSRWIRDLKEKFWGKDQDFLFHIQTYKVVVVTSASQLLKGSSMDMTCQV